MSFADNKANESIDNAHADAHANRDATATAEDARLAKWEIVSLIVSIIIAEWLVFSIGGGSNLLVGVVVTITFAFIFLSHHIRREPPRELGFRLDNFVECARLLALPMLVFTLVCLALGWFTSSIDFARWRGGHSLLILPALGIMWGLLQQYVLQSFVNRRAQIIWGRGAHSVLVVALVFGALHLPNPGLTLATFAGGVVWATVYQRAPNLFALALSHGLMTWLLISTVPPWALRGLRVGFKYFG